VVQAYILDPLLVILRNECMAAGWRHGLDAPHVSKRCLGTYVAYFLLKYFYIKKYKNINLKYK
jgi:hypothetical protein